MYFVQIESWFESAHQLRNYDGKCKNIHGHNFKVVVQFRTKTLDDRGMVVDFLDVERELQKITEKLDHKMLNEIPPFDRINPTVENLARYIFESLEGAFPQATLHAVQVYETDRFVATYMKDGYGTDRE